VASWEFLNWTLYSLRCHIRACIVLEFGVLQLYRRLALLAVFGRQDLPGPTHTSALSSRRILQAGATRRASANTPIERLLSGCLHLVEVLPAVLGMVTDQFVLVGNQRSVYFAIARREHQIRLSAAIGV